MRFVLNEKKLAQAACWLLNRAGGTLNYMVLIKLLYLADRGALIDTGMPITGDRMVSMNNGPVLSGTLDQINMGKRIEAPSTPWYDYISEPDGYVVSAKEKDGPTDELSRYELRVLEEIFSRYGHTDKWALVDFTHTLPEWRNPHGSALPIDPIEILRAVGKPDAEIEAMVAGAEEVWLIRELVAATN